MNTPKKPTPEELKKLIDATWEKELTSWGDYDLNKELQKFEVAASTQDRTADLLSNLQ